MQIWQLTYMSTFVNVQLCLNISRVIVEFELVKMKSSESDKKVHEMKRKWQNIEYQGKWVFNTFNLIKLKWNKEFLLCHQFFIQLRIIRFQNIQNFPVRNVHASKWNFQYFQFTFLNFVFKLTDYLVQPVQIQSDFIRIYWAMTTIWDCLSITRVLIHWWQH